MIGVLIMERIVLVKHCANTTYQHHHCKNAKRVLVEGQHKPKVKKG